MKVPHGIIETNVWAWFNLGDAFFLPAATQMHAESSGALYPFRVCANIFNFAAGISPAVEADLKVCDVGVTDVIQHRCGKR
jgi:hypothetical protein